MRVLLFAFLVACTEPKTGAEPADDTSAAVAHDSACAALPWYPDGDADGWGLLEGVVEACSVPPGYIELAGDCDDANAEIRPDAAEICDDIDNDCDALVDDEDSAVSGAPTWYLDEDRDGWAGETYSMQACDGGDGWWSVTGDCDDTNADVSPDEVESCNGIDDDCDGEIDVVATEATDWSGSYELRFFSGTMGYAFDMTCTGELESNFSAEDGWSFLATNPTACCEEVLGQCFTLDFEMLNHHGGAEAWGEVGWEGSDVGTWEGTWTEPACGSGGALEATTSAELYFVPFWTYVWMSGTFDLNQIE